MEISFVHIV